MTDEILNEGILNEGEVAEPEHGAEPIEQDGELGQNTEPEPELDGELTEQGVEPEQESEPEQNTEPEQGGELEPEPEPEPEQDVEPEPYIEPIEPEPEPESPEPVEQQESYTNITRRLDGSYVIDRNDMPYHIPNEGEWAEQWAKVDAYAQEHPDEVTVETPPPDPTLEELKARKLQELAAARYEHETGGVTFAGVTVDTDRESQALITGAALAATLDSAYTLNWKTSSGAFVTLTAEQIIAIAQAVRAHVQQCFDMEAQLVPLVEAAETAEQLEAIAFTWPE